MSSVIANISLTVMIMSLFMGIRLCFVNHAWKTILNKVSIIARRCIDAGEDWKWVYERYEKVFDVDAMMLDIFRFRWSVYDLMDDSTEKWFHNLEEEDDCHIN